MGSLGAPLVPVVADVDRVSFATAQWTLTAAMLAGAISTPWWAGSGEAPRAWIIATLTAVVAGMQGCPAAGASTR